MRPPLAVLLGALLAASGCTMMPKYARPAAPVPSAWPSPSPSPAEAVQPLAAAEIPWQDFFVDPRLRQVIELSLAHNRDLRVATLNVERAQALYRVQRAELFPAIGVLATADKYSLPGKMTDSGRAETVQEYAVNVGTAAWEVDLFGRVRSLKAGALAQYLATDQARRAAQTALVATVAGTWLTLAADQEALALAQATVDAQRASRDLIRQSRDFGIASDLDLRQADSQVEAARADVARLTGLVALGHHALDLVAGTPLSADLLPDRTLGVVTALPDLAPGLPSEVLLLRPDIMAAEERLRASNANIGAARAAFFPRISLTAAVGTLSEQLSGLFGAGTGTWTFAPQVSAPIYAFGAQRANLRAAWVERDIAVAQYEKAIQVAFREVSDALALRTTLVEQHAAVEALVSALADAYRLSDARYQAGIDGYLGVLVAQRALFTAQQSLVGVRLAEQVNLVALYKALGGGTGRPAGERPAQP